MKAVITVVGKDKIGIIAGTTNVLSEYGVNILDISQTILQDYFTMVMVVDLKEMKIDFESLKDNIDKKGQALGVSIKIQHEDIFNAMHQI
jgi:ACT domain-containing protein